MDDEIPLQGGSHASSSHEVSLEPTTKRREDLGKHNVRTHFPRDRNCEICKRTKIRRAPCRRRNGDALPRLNPKHSAKHAYRTGTSASSTARAVTSYEMIRQKTRSTSNPLLISSLSRTFTSGKADHTVTDTERKKVIKNTTLQINSKRSVRNDNS